MLIAGVGRRSSHNRIIATGSARAGLTRLLRRDGNTVADYQPGNYTGTLNASAWLNSIGAAPSLAQASGAAQPIIVSNDYVKKAYLPGVASNDFTTPDKAPFAVTDLSVAVRVAANDWTPAAVNSFASQYQDVGNEKGWIVGLNINGTLRLQFSPDGVADVIKSSTAAPTIADGSALWLLYTLDVDNGAAGYDIKFYTAPDSPTVPSSWTQLGNTVTTAAATSLFDSTAKLTIGNYDEGAGIQPLAGKVYRLVLYSGIGGAAVADWQASDWSETTTNGATQVSSTTGETWTLNNTAIATPAAIVASPFIATDEVATWMRSTYTAAQPRTYYMVGMDPVWNAGKYIADGTTANKLGLSKTTGTPKISMNAGTAGADDANFTLRAKHVLTLALNGATSTIQVDGNAATACSVNTGNPGGLTIGGDGGTPTAGTFGGFWFSEIIDRSGADSAATQAQIQALLKAIHGTP